MFVVTQARADRALPKFPRLIRSINFMGHLECTSHVPTLGAGVDTGAPYEYLHWLQAEHLSNLTSLSNVQNLQDHILYLVLASLGFSMQQTLQIGANGCINHTLFTCKITYVSTSL